MREDFSALRLPDEIVARYPPDRQGLFDLLRSLTTDEILRSIALCDNGSGYEEHLEGLMRIRAGVALDGPIGWEPNEVLTLYRWGDFADQREISNQMTFHVARAFCCGALMRVADHNDNRSLFANDALAPLIESCLVLGEPFRVRLGGQIVWGMGEMEPWDEDYPFHAFGLVATIAHVDGKVAESLGSWLVRANREIMPWHQEMSRDAKDFMSMRYVSTSPERWWRLIHAVMGRVRPESEIGLFLREMLAKKPRKFGCSVVRKLLRLRY